MLLFITHALALDLDNYRLSGAPWEAEGSLGLTGAEVGAPGTWSLGLAGVVANEPAPGAVEALDTLRMAFGVVPIKNLRVELEVPAHLGVLTEEGWGSGLGDPELRLRLGLGEVKVAGREVHLAIEPIVGLPNGDAALGIGGGDPSGGVVFPAGTRISEKVRVDAQLAVVSAPKGVVDEVPLGAWFGYGAGVTWDGPHDLHVSGELTGRVDLEGAVGEGDTPLDLGVGISWAREGGIGVALGGSVGLIEGPGAPAQRVVLAVGWLQRPAGSEEHRAHGEMEVAERHAAPSEHMSTSAETETSQSTVATHTTDPANETPDAAETLHPIATPAPTALAVTRVPADEPAPVVVARLPPPPEWEPAPAPARSAEASESVHRTSPPSSQGSARHAVPAESARAPTVGSPSAALAPASVATRTAPVAPAPVVAARPPVGSTTSAPTASPEPHTVATPANMNAPDAPSAHITVATHTDLAAPVLVATSEGSPDAAAPPAKKPYTRPAQTDFKKLADDLRREDAEEDDFAFAPDAISGPAPADDDPDLVASDGR